MRLFKLTKETVSVIRKDREGVEGAQADGYALDGEVNEAYEVINAHPSFKDAPAELEAPPQDAPTVPSQHAVKSKKQRGVKCRPSWSA
jgi:hypothetical protein